MPSSGQQIQNFNDMVTAAKKTLGRDGKSIEESGKRMRESIRNNNRPVVNSLTHLLTGLATACAMLDCTVDQLVDMIFNEE